VYVASRRRLAEAAEVTAKFLILDASMPNADTTADFRFAISSVEGSFEAVNYMSTLIDVPAGVEVGEELGISVGAPVGEAVRVVGACVGASVGAVGALVGASVGDTVGELDGEFVGLLVGANVGELVGLLVDLSAYRILAQRDSSITVSIGTGVA